MLKTSFVRRARNRLKGKITDIVLGGVMAHVTVGVEQNYRVGHYAQKRKRIEAKKGDAVMATVKATEVMIDKTG